MAKHIVVRGDEVEVTVELDEGTAVVDELLKRLPMQTEARLRGKELQLSILVPDGIQAPDRREVEVGDVAYRAEDNALCLFFGSTPLDTDKESPLALVGRIVEGMDDCNLVRQNESLRIETSEG